MADAGVLAVDPGLGADLLAAIIEGDAQRATVRERIGDLRDVSGLGDLLTATRARSAILDCAAGAAETFDLLESSWSTVHSAITNSAWQGIAVDPVRWRCEFVAERIERPLPVSPRPEMSSTPPSRFHSFSHPEVVPTARRFRISEESLVALTFDDIRQGLSGTRHSAVIECAARWRYLASVLDSSVDPVDRLVTARCGADGAVAATGINSVIDATRRVAASWTTIGNAVRSFGLGLRHAGVTIDALRSERDEAMAMCAANPGLIEQQSVIWAKFETRARASFDETYGAGLFALVAGLALAGEPRTIVDVTPEVGELAR